MLTVPAADWQPKVTVLHRLSDLRIISGRVPDTCSRAGYSPRRRKYWGNKKVGLNRTGFYTHVTMAGIALSLVLAGCASQPGADPAAPRSTTGSTAGAAPAVTA